MQGIRRVERCKQFITLPNSGEKIELYYTYALADALGVHPRTARRWELNGAIPKSCFMTELGLPLYSQEQIDVAASLLFESKYIVSNKKTGERFINNTSFPRQCKKAFSELQKKYLGG